MEEINFVCNDLKSVLSIAKEERRVGMEVIINGIILSLVRNPNSEKTELKDWVIKEMINTCDSYTKSSYCSIIIKNLVAPMIIDKYAKILNKKTSEIGIKISRINTVTSAHDPDNNPHVDIKYWVYDLNTLNPYSYSSMKIDIEDTYFPITLTNEDEIQN